VETKTENKEKLFYSKLFFLSEGKEVQNKVEKVDPNQGDQMSF
jgi:hypothetical protein